MNDSQQTPVQEAISLISIAAILFAIACYVAALQNVPIISTVLFWVATQVYHWFPALGYLRSPQIPILVAAATAGGAFWLVGLAFAGVLAAWLSAGQLAGLERQTARLKRNRVRITKSRRDRDGFDVR